MTGTRHTASGSSSSRSDAKNEALAALPAVVQSASSQAAATSVVSPNWAQGCCHTLLKNFLETNACDL